MTQKLYIVKVYCGIMDRSPVANLQVSNTHSEAEKR